MALIEEAHKAARLLLDHAYVRIAARAEPDAVCAAAILTHALRRENVDVHVTWLARLDSHAAQALADEAPEALMLLGLSGDDAHSPPAGARRIALDRANATLDAEAILDPARSHDAHAELSLSALAQLVAIGISRRSADLAPLALAGALCAHAGRPSGLDAEIAADAVDSETMVRAPTLSLHGPTLTQALAQLDVPYVAGLTGRARNVKKLVGELGLAGDAPPTGVEGADAEKLGSYLALRLLEQGAPDAALDALFRPAHRALKGPLTGFEMGDVARRVEAACAAGRPSLAFAAAWPDSGALAEIAEIGSAARDEIVAALLRAERERRVEGALVVADAPRATACALVADRVATSLAPAGATSVARHADAVHVTLAARAIGGKAHVGKALRHAAAATGALVVGTRGEGRASVPVEHEGHFLKALAEALA